MLRFARRIFRSLIRETLVRETRGAEIAEAAAVLPLMFMMILGIFWFGQAFSIYGTITRAAQEGARAAVAPVCTTCAPASISPAQNAYNAVQSVLVTAKLDPTKLQKPVPVPTLLACKDGSAVQCVVIAGNVCVQPAIQLSTTGLGGAGICGVSVSFQYPYQFWLPFTSLNKQQIWLQAQARMSLETH